MPRRYEQKTYMEASGRGFWGTAFWLGKWIIVALIALAIIGLALG